MSATDRAQSNGLPDQLKFQVKSSNRKLTTFLLACCFALTVFSACLLTALVLIGKFYVHNKSFHENFPINTSVEFDRSLKIENMTMSRASGPGIEIQAKLYRLPESVRPTHYDITLRPNLETGVLNGSVKISIEIAKRVQYIVLNAHMLNISDVAVSKYDDITIPIRNVAIDKRLQTLAIYLDYRLEPGDYFVSINYLANMKNTLHGMYLSYYRGINNEKRAIASSKFEPTYARRAFPCFDEPQLKAKFSVHILKPDDPNYIALSNMPEESRETVEDGVMVHFKQSVRMSTYLTCFVVCDFDYNSEVIHGNTDVPFRIFATSEQKSKTEFATGIGKQIIEYFNKYFELDFPLPKLDMIAVPDFPSGAMENWGLVTFKESALLYHPNISTSVDKQEVASVVAHEFVHSWFGNLVTMKWWNDLWLSEGFASYILFKGVDEVLDEEWKMSDQFIIEKMHGLLKLDATLSSHPIVAPVITPDEITSIFDTITYSKGATILRMLEDAVSEEVFRSGVTNYLKAHAYDNAVSDDFWDELSALVQDVDVSTFMKTWITQTGYPVVNVKIKNSSYVLTQERYLTDPDAQDTVQAPFDYKWVIPVTYITDENSSSVLVWFQHDDHEIEIAKPSNSRWVKFNYKQVGMFRVNYEEQHWRELIGNVHEMEIADRAHLIEETFALAESGHISYEIPLNLSRYLMNEGDYVPWSAFAYSIRPIVELLKHSEYLDKFNKYLQNLVNPAYHSFSWSERETDRHLDRRARLVVVTLACLSGVKHCTKTAAQLFVDWLEDKSPAVSQDLREIVYRYGMKHSSPEHWDALFEKFVSERDAGEKMRLLRGLANVKDTIYLSKLIELAKNEKYIRRQNYFHCLGSIAANPIGTPLVWDYVRENWPSLVERFTLNDRSLGRLISFVTSSFSTQTKLEEIFAFYSKYPEAGAGEATRHLAVERVRNKMKWLRKYKQTVENWISDESF